jgi:hypothetical protein
MSLKYVGLLRIGMLMFLRPVTVIVRPVASSSPIVRPIRVCRP